MANKLALQKNMIIRPESKGCMRIWVINGDSPLLEKNLVLNLRLTQWRLLRVATHTSRKEVRAKATLLLTIIRPGPRRKTEKGARNC